jgi:uncharacterized membrane protein YidH (DUF202 family)
MTPSLPIPTDNIYKFACLFGLALIVVSIFSYVSTYSSALDRKVKYMEVIIPLEAQAERSKVDDNRLELNQKLLDVTKENERAAKIGIEIILGIGTALSIFGAYNWYEKIHKRDDKLAQLQIEKLEAEVVKLRNELTNSNPSSSESNAEP